MYYALQKVGDKTKIQRQSKFDCLVYEMLFYKRTKTNFEHTVWLHPGKVIFIAQIILYIHCQILPYCHLAFCILVENYLSEIETSYFFASFYLKMCFEVSKKVLILINLLHSLSRQPSSQSTSLQTDLINSLLHITVLPLSYYILILKNELFFL